MGISSITVVANSLRLRRFGASGRATPRAQPRPRAARASASAALLPVALLGALMLAAPATFTVARDAARAIGTMAGMDMSDMSATATARVERSGGRCTLSLCPILTPGPNELSVAGELGSALAAVWVTHAGANVDARLELLSPTMAPVAEPVSIAGASSRQSCGPGCWTFALPAGATTVGLSAKEHGHQYALSLPVRWRQGQSATARRLLDRAVASMRALAGVSVYETLTSGPPHPVEKIGYRFSAPERMEYTVATGGRVIAVGATLWAFTPGQGWQRSSYNGAGGSFSTSSWYDWQEYDQSAQLLDERDRERASHGRHRAHEPDAAGVVPAAHRSAERPGRPGRHGRRRALHERQLLAVRHAAADPPAGRRALSARRQREAVADPLRRSAMSAPVVVVITAALLPPSTRRTSPGARIRSAAASP